MGHGLPMAVGMALASERSGASWKTYCLMSDGELNCGTTWESAAIAAHHELDNLILIVDANGWQAMGKPEDVLNMEPLDAKWKAFGWETIEIDGHDYAKLEMALRLKKEKKPLVIIARTTKGKGVSFMENNPKFHGTAPTPAEVQLALQELQ